MSDVDRLASLPPAPPRAVVLGAGLLVALIALIACACVSRFALGTPGVTLLLSAAVVAVPTAAATFVLWRIVTRSANVPWIVAIGVLAAVVGAVAGSTNPWDHARLEHAVDALHLPGKVIAHQRRGNPRCSPRCTTVERRLRIEGQRRDSVASQVVTLLKRADLTFRKPAKGRQADSIYFTTASGSRYSLTYGVGADAADGSVDVVVRATAK